MGLFNFSNKKQPKSNINWQTLETKEQVDAIFKASETKTQLIFKHSTRCSISAMAKNRLESNWKSEIAVDTHYLDLISFRDVSNYIAEKSSITHESPQVILIQSQKPIYHASHNGIKVEEIEKNLS